MRIIGGIHRGRKINSLQGKDTRPTLDFVREALFNIIGQDIAGSSFMDAYAGTGAVGMEALSRGAKDATFVEKSVKACHLIRENLRSLDFLNRSQIFNSDTLFAFEKMKLKGLTFDVIFMDPPYNSGELDKSLKFLLSSQLLKPGALIIAQYSFGEVSDLSGYSLMKQKKYGKTVLTFLRSDKT